MPVNTTTNTSLSLTIDGGDEMNCQIIDCSFVPPSNAVGDRVLTACADGEVINPGSPENGSLTGNVYADPLDGGITDTLLTAQENDADMAFVLTFWNDQANTVAMTFTGTARVNSMQLDFARPGYAQHPIDLAVITSTRTRPA